MKVRNPYHQTIKTIALIIIIVHDNRIRLINMYKSLISISISIQSWGLCGHKSENITWTRTKTTHNRKQTSLQARACTTIVPWCSRQRTSWNSYLCQHTSVFFPVFIYNLLANHVSNSLFVWYKPIYKWTWNLPDYLKSQRLSRD